MFYKEKIPDGSSHSAETILPRIMDLSLIIASSWMVSLGKGTK